MTVSPTATNGAVLTVNSGSSSLKFALFAAEGGGACMVRGEISDLAAACELDMAYPVSTDERRAELLAIRRD